MSRQTQRIESFHCDWCQKELGPDFVYFSVYPKSSATWPLANPGYPLRHQMRGDPEFCSVEHAQAYKDQIVIVQIEDPRQKRRFLPSSLYSLRDTP